MAYSAGGITLDGLLSLNVDEVQAHLNSIQWPHLSDTSPFTVFYQETRAISILIATIDSFLMQTELNQDIASRGHLLALRNALGDEYRTRLSYMSNNHDSNQ